MKIIFACTLLIHCAYAFEYQVAFLVGDEEHSFCGGCILNTQVILTAAHCFDEGYDPEDLKVLAGSNMVAEYDTRQIVKVANYVLHPEYIPKGDFHDLAMVMLSEMLHFNEYVKALDLPQPNTFPKGNAKFAGWSLPDKFGQRRPLQGGYVKIVAHFDCLTLENDDEKKVDLILKYDTIICTKITNKTKMRRGDSGTPLVQDNMVIGIADSSVKRKPLSVFTRVSAYVKWIRTTLSASDAMVKTEL